MKKLYLYFISILILTGSPINAFAQTRYVTSIHPFAEIIREISGEREAVTALLPAGASPHTFELRPSHLRQIEKATALIYGSPELDGWVSKVPSENKIQLLDFLPESYRLRMIMRDHDHDHGQSGDIDPHFWLDPLAVKALLPSLTAKLSELNPQGKEKYRANAERFAAELDSLNSEITVMLKPVKGENILIAHPFMQYFCNRYQIVIAGAIETIPGKEPTPKTLKGVISLMQKERIRLILTQKQLPNRAAEVVAESTGGKIVYLDPLGGIEGRVRYSDLIRYNAKALLEALSE
ncbi:MAG: metal ABC transporter substrate-binding protein [Calditrichaceae bacterium]